MTYDEMVQCFISTDGIDDDCFSMSKVDDVGILFFFWKIHWISSSVSLVGVLHLTVLFVLMAFWAIADLNFGYFIKKMPKYIRPSITIHVLLGVHGKN